MWSDHSSFKVPPMVPIEQSYNLYRLLNKILLRCILMMFLDTLKMLIICFSKAKKTPQKIAWLFLGVGMGLFWKTAEL